MRLPKPGPASTALRRSRAPSPLLAVCLIASFAGCVAPLAPAQDPVSRLADLEVQRRARLTQDADAQLREADLLRQSGQHAEALAAYGTALRTLPDSPAVAGLRDFGTLGYAEAATARARQLLGEGKRTEAAELLNSALAENMRPDHKGARALLREMADPDRHPPALTPRHVENVKRIQDLLRRAQSFHELGDFDSAVRTAQDALRIDPYNNAARRIMERAENEKARYYESARNHTRGRMLTEVSSLWEDAIPPSRADLASYETSRTESVSKISNSRDRLLRNMRTLMVPRVDFANATLGEVLEFLRVRSRDLDPEGRGVDFVLNVPEQTADRQLTLSLENIPLEELVRYVAEQSGTAYRIDDFAVRFVSLTEDSTDLVVMQYRVPPGFIETAPAEAAASPDPFSQQPAGGGALRRLTAREFLEARGVTFPDGATATYSTATNNLVVRNTRKNQEVVEMLVEQAAASAPKQALITVKMVEVNQNNLNELGFDWLLGAFNVPGSNGVFGSGGTVGNQMAPDALGENFPIQYPGTNIPVGMNPMTAGLRSSGELFARPTIDNLMGENITAPTVDSRSPGQFAVAGVLTDPQFQVVVRAINQRKSIDFVSMPSIVAKSGQKATVDIIREFLYPTEFDPPQIPQQVGSAQIGNLRLITDNRTAPITPSTPTNFEMRKLGTVIEVEPVISDDGREVELLIAPQNTEFEGFIDYGSPIENPLDLGNGPGVQLVDNRIIQPIFRTNKASTAVRVYDGSTVVLGGVIAQRAVEVRDKVPVIGSIPLVGRLWRSSVTVSEKKNFVIFVTVRVIDPSGLPLNPATAAR
jgi:general secretion pathway protein D